MQLFGALPVDSVEPVDWIMDGVINTGDGKVLKVDTKHDYVWMDDGGNVISTDSSPFNSSVDAGGISYRQLEPI